MSEEEYTQVKISMPLIDDIELQRIDTFYNDIVEEYTKAFVKEKEQVILQRVMKNLQQENSLLKEDIKGFEQERQTLYNTIHDLQKANKQLNRKRKKAIEYIENDLQSFLYSVEYKKLLELLKGDE